MQDYEGGFWSKRYTIFSILLAVIITALHLTAFTASHAYTSDETHLQVMFANDAVVSGQPKWFGISSFISKLPFIYLARFFSNYSRFGIFLPTLLVDVICAVLFMVGSMYFFNKYRYSRWSILPALWVLTLGGNFIFNLFLLNSRNFEIGLIFFTLALLDYFLDNRQFISNKKFITISAVMVMLWGFIAVTDSFYIYMLFAPLALYAAVAFFKTKKTGYKDVFLLTLAGLLATGLFYLIYTALNYHSYPVIIRFDDYTNVTHKIANLPFTLLSFTGNSFFRAVIKPTTVAKFLGASLTVLGLYGLYAIAQDKTLEKFEFIKIFPFIAALNLIVWLFSDRSSDHYLIMLPFILAIGLAYLLCKTKFLKWLIISLALAAVVGNSAIIAKDYLHAKRSSYSPNSANYELITEVNRLGLTKGYVEFWDGPINTYLSGNKVKFIQTLCYEQKLYINHWYLSASEYSAQSQKSFFTLNTAFPQGCSEAIITKQLGDPSQIVTYKNYRFYIYDYDITGKIF